MDSDGRCLPRSHTAWSCYAFTLSLLSTQPEAAAGHAATQERIPDFIHSSQISTWQRKRGVMQIGPINHLGWLSHVLQAAKALININCWRFPASLEKFSRLTRIQYIFWSLKAEEWIGPQGTELQPSAHKPPSWCAGRERKVNSLEGWKKQPRELHGGIRRQ